MTNWRGILGYAILSFVVIEILVVVGCLFPKVSMIPISMELVVANILLLLAASFLIFVKPRK